MHTMHVHNGLTAWPLELQLSQYHWPAEPESPCSSRCSSSYSIVSVFFCSFVEWHLTICYPPFPPLTLTVTFLPLAVSYSTMHSLHTALFLKGLCYSYKIMNQCCIDWTTELEFHSISEDWTQVAILKIVNFTERWRACISDAGLLKH